MTELFAEIDGQRIEIVEFIPDVGRPIGVTGTIRTALIREMWTACWPARTGSQHIRIERGGAIEVEGDVVVLEYELDPDQKASITVIDKRDIEAHSRRERELARRMSFQEAFRDR